MEYVKDFRWNKGMNTEEFAERVGKIGFQGIEIDNAVRIITEMRRIRAKTFLTFTSNMVTSGLRGFFAQLIEIGIVDVIATTAGSVEEDIMKAKGEQFPIGKFNADDIELYEKGVNRVGNIFIRNESYERFEQVMKPILNELYKKQKRWAVSEMLKEIGLMLEDNNSILYQAARKNVPIFCPAITDGAIGFHLFMFQQEHPDFIVDVVKDFSNILFATSQDDKKGLIALGGGVSKHHAILSCLLNGGLDYAVYMTTSRETSGSMSGATTNEAKSWGKIKDDSEAATVIGDVSITFPLAMCRVLEILAKEGIIKISK
jgi:deoxyhypusine synthase